MAYKEGSRQHSYMKSLIDKPGGGQGYKNPYEWKKPKPKQAKKKVDKKAFDSNFS